MVVANLMEALSNRGHSVGVTCIEYRGTLADYLEQRHYRVSLVPLPGWKTIFRPTALIDWLRSLAPDVVHIHSGAWPKAANAARLANVPRILHTEHGLLDQEPWFHPLLKRWAGRFTRPVVGVSAPLTEYLVHEVGIRPEFVRLVTNGVDTDRFRPGSRSGRIRSAFGLPSDALLIGHVGRLVPVKNHGMMLQCMARIRSRFPEAFLVLVGSGPLRAAIEEEAVRMKVSDRVLFFGETTDLPPIYTDFNAFILPSHAEGTSMAVLEAMATGLPVVATAVGGTPHLLAHGNAGVLCPPGRLTEFADALVGVLADPEIRRKLGDRARRRVVDSFSIDAMTTAYEKLYAGEDLPPGES